MFFCSQLLVSSFIHVAELLQSSAKQFVLCSNSKYHWYTGAP